MCKWRPANLVRSPCALGREHEAERMELCRTCAKFPAKYFTDTIHLIMDNKKFDIPTSQVGKRSIK